MSRNADAINDFSRSLWAGFKGLPIYRLSRKEQRALGGHLFPEAAVFVRAVGRGLRRRKELFPDIAVSGEALLDGLAEADAWRVAMLRLASLLAVASASYVKTQSAVVIAARAVLRQVEQTAKFSVAGDEGLDHLGRFVALRPASRILERRNARKNRARKKTLKGAQAGPGPRPMESGTRPRTGQPGKRRPERSR